MSNMSLDTSKTWTERIPPQIETIEFFDSEGEPLKTENGWVKLEENTVIRVKVSGKTTKVDFYAGPTGTDAHLLQQLIGEAFDDDEDSMVELKWDIPEAFMGRVWVLAYNSDVARRSGEFEVIYEIQ